MSGNVLKITSKNDLENVVKNNKNALQRLDEDKREEFKKNFMELWGQEYLLKEANATELLDFCIQITNLGLSINPMHKELYILPFAQKGKNGKKLEAVYTKFGVQELCFQSGFQLEIDTIWKVSGNDVRSKDLSLGERARLNFTDIKNVEDNFLGFYFELVDLNSKLKTQNCVIGLDYLKEVTKQLQSKTHQIANYVHKATRKAMSDFFIPRSRGSLEVLNQLDSVNYQTTIDAEPIPEAKTSEVQQLDIKVENRTAKSEVVQEATMEGITAFYNNSEKKTELNEILTGSGWNDFNQQQLNELMEKLKKV